MFRKISDLTSTHRASKTETRERNQQLKSKSTRCKYKCTYTEREREREQESKRENHREKRLKHAHIRGRETVRHGWSHAIHNILRAELKCVPLVGNVPPWFVY